MYFNKGPEETAIDDAKISRELWQPGSHWFFSPYLSASKWPQLHFQDSVIRLPYPQQNKTKNNNNNNLPIFYQKHS